MSNSFFELRILLKLGDFNLDVDIASSGQSLGIFGASGSGKTSFLECVAGWRTPLAGLAKIGDVVLFDSGRNRSYPIDGRGIGYVPQDALLFPHKSVLQNIRCGFSRADTPDNHLIERTIATLEIQHLLQRTTLQLSGGEKQRVALARALASRPRLLLLDEPLGSLDTPLRRRILPYLIRVREEFGLPTLFVSHDATEVQALCDDVIVLEEGKVREQGDPRRVLRRASSEERAFENVLAGFVTELRDESALVALDGNVEVQIPGNGVRIGSRVLFAVGSDDILIARDRPARISARNILPATIVEITHASGADVRLDMRMGRSDGAAISASLTRSAVEELELRPGSEVFAVFKTRACSVLSA